jgi:DNA-binding transcriptional ArsR family regulator
MRWGADSPPSHPSQRRLRERGDLGPSRERRGARESAGGGHGEVGRNVPADKSSAPESLAPRLIELTAKRLWVVAEPNRIALLDLLRGGEAGVQDLADRVGLPRQNVSHHLALLWREKIVSRRSEGAMTLYAIEDWSAWWVIEQIARMVQSDSGEEEVSDE